MSRSGEGNSFLRHAPVTIYNYDWDTVIKLAEEAKISYFICQEEVCPDTKREHIQGYVQFTRSTRLQAARKIFPKDTHFTIPCKGTAEENRKYCSKIESRKPDGRSFECGAIRTQGKRTDLEAFKTAIEEGKSEAEIAETHFSTWAIHPNLFKRYKCVKIKPRDRAIPPQVTVYVGPTGVGKSKRCFDEHKDDVYIKDATKWWDGYYGQRCILLDEFMPSNYWTMHELLRFLDRYPFKGETKGGHVEINSPFIEITSNAELDTLFPFESKEHLDALNRRISNKVNL